MFRQIWFGKFDSKHFFLRMLHRIVFQIHFVNGKWISFLKILISRKYLLVKHVSIIRFYRGVSDVFATGRPNVRRVHVSDYPFPSVVMCGDLLLDYERNALDNSRRIKKNLYYNTLNCINIMHFQKLKSNKYKNDID